MRGQHAAYCGTKHGDCLCLSCQHDRHPTYVRDSCCVSTHGEGNRNDKNCAVLYCDNYKPEVRK